MAMSSNRRTSVQAIHAPTCQAPDGRNELDFENDSNRIIADSAVW